MFFWPYYVYSYENKQKPNDIPGMKDHLSLSLYQQLCCLTNCSQLAHSKVLKCDREQRTETWKFKESLGFLTCGFIEGFTVNILPVSDSSLKGLGLEKKFILTRLMDQ